MRTLKTAEWAEIVVEASKTKPVLVDFTAGWCGPCQTMAPALETAAKNMGDKCAVYKLDIDKSSAIADAENIRAIPTLIVYVDGKPAGRTSGIKTAKQIASFVNKFSPSED